MSEKGQTMTTKTNGRKHRVSQADADNMTNVHAAAILADHARWTAGELETRPYSARIVALAMRYAVGVLTRDVLCEFSGGGMG
jgi:hypothetical protein